MKQKNDFVDFVARSGANINNTIIATIALSAKRKKPISFEFNHVIVTVNWDSKQSLIHRDYSRAYRRYIDNNIGPYPNPILTDEEKANDAHIKANNEREWQRQYEEELKAKRREDAGQSDVSQTTVRI